MKIFCALFIGIFIGFILTKMQYIAAALLGALAGQIVGLAIYNLLFISVDSTVLLVFLSLLCMGIMAFLTFRFYDHIVIITTSFIGSYSFIRGFSIIGGHFPSEILLINNIMNGVATSIDW
jgi:hypothetical protein